MGVVPFASLADIGLSGWMVRVIFGKKDGNAAVFLNGVTKDLGDVAVFAVVDPAAPTRARNGQRRAIRVRQCI